MRKIKDGQIRGKYTLEFKLEAVRLVEEERSVIMTAKIPDVQVQTQGNWLRLSSTGQLKAKALATSR